MQEEDVPHDAPNNEMTYCGIRVSTLAFGLVLSYTCVLAVSSAGKSGSQAADGSAGTPVPNAAVPAVAQSTAPLSSALQISLPPLQYSHDSLAPYISRETIDFHYGKHQAGYVTKLNLWLASNPEVLKLIRDAQSVAPSSVVTALLRKLPKPSPTYNLAAQIFNHALYFATLARDAPLSGIDASQPFRKAIAESFGDVGRFREEVRNQAISHFGSGWVWLLANHSSGSPRLLVISTHDAETPISADDAVVPLAVCDVWEHAYYVDYRNDRARYVDAWFEATDWNAVARRYLSATVEIGDAASQTVRSYPSFV